MGNNWKGSDFCVQYVYISRDTEISMEKYGGWAKTNWNCADPPSGVINSGKLPVDFLIHQDQPQPHIILNAFIQPPRHTLQVIAPTTTPDQVKMTFSCLTKAPHFLAIIFLPFFDYTAIFYYTVIVLCSYSNIHVYLILNNAWDLWDCQAGHFHTTLHGSINCIECILHWAYE